MLFRSEINYVGNRIGFTNALWTGFELLDLKEEGEHSSAKVKMLGGNLSVNDLLSLLMPHVQILGLQEVIPSMNDIFIKQVSENRN